MDFWDVISKRILILLYLIDLRHLILWLEGQFVPHTQPNVLAIKVVVI